MIIKDLGAVTAYAAAVEKGYTGTEAEYAELMASYATVAEEAAESAESASQSATQAGASAQTATTKAGEASTSATQAGASATSASQSAQIATTKASEASASASTASTKASEASQSATTASSKASEASASATSAQTAQTGAETAQGLAENARDDAIDAKTDAESARDLAQQYAESIDPEKIYSAYPTDTASGAVATFADGADDIPMKSVKVAIEPVQSGSGDPSPDNVRPISGWTGAQVVRTGVNVWDEVWEVGTIRQTDGLFAPDNTRIRSKNFNPCVPETTYYVKDPTNNSNISLRWYDANKGFVSSSNWIGNTTITSPANAYYFAFVVASAYGTTYNNDISINYPATNTDYHPYQGDTHSITFPTEAGTVYGGVLDVTSGTLTVDMAFIASYNGETLPSEWISDRDKYVAGTTPTTGAQVCYKLSQAVVYTLAPTEIKSLLGDNNVWADAGDTTVTYRADTKLYIEKKMAGTDIPMIADSNIVSGSYFMIGDNLYKATANIASGAAVVVGTNATAKTMAEALNEINA